MMKVYKYLTSRILSVQVYEIEREVNTVVVLV